jgi:hypothetical protein
VLKQEHVLFLAYGTGGAKKNKTIKQKQTKVVVGFAYYLFLAKGKKENKNNLRFLFMAP